MSPRLQPLRRPTVGRIRVGSGQAARVPERPRSGRHRSRCRRGSLEPQVLSRGPPGDLQSLCSPRCDLPRPGPARSGARDNYSRLPQPEELAWRPTCPVVACSPALKGWPCNCARRTTWRSAPLPGWQTPRRPPPGHERQLPQQSRVRRTRQQLLNVG